MSESRLSAADRELRIQKLKKQWWWLNPEFADQKHARALAWELIRRSSQYLNLHEVYPSLVRGFVSKSVRSDPIPYLHLRAMVQQAVGPELCDLLTEKFPPGSTWIELSAVQRRSFEKAAAFLPRESSPATTNPDMGLFLVELSKKSESEIVSDQAWNGYALKSIKPQGFPILGDTSFKQRFVVISFDYRLGKPTQRAQLDELLRRRFETPANADLDKLLTNPAEAGELKYPDFWKPETKMDGGRHYADDVKVTPSNDDPYVLCWIPCSHNLKTLPGTISQPDSGRESRPKN